MPEPTVLHRCPTCGQVFDQPSVCSDGTPTIAYPDVVPKQSMFPAPSGRTEADGAD